MHRRIKALGFAEAIAPFAAVVFVVSPVWAQAPEDTSEDVPPATSAAPAPPAAPAPVAPAEPVEEVATQEDLDELRSWVKELDERTSKVERDQALDRLSWTANYRTILSSYWYKGPSPDGQPIQVEKTHGEQWLHRLRLDLRTDPEASVRFTGRMTMFKRYGTNTATPFPQDSTETRIPRDASLRLERAWLDWFITDYLALSAGRISYSDGPPNELKDNRSVPDATWGQQMVDGEYETVDLTAIIIPEHLLVRGFYASWSFPRQDDLFSSSLFLNDGTENLRIIGGNLDIRAQAAGSLFVQLGAYHVPKFRPFTVPIPNPAPPPNPSNAPPPFDGSLVFPSDKPASLGSYSNFSALVMWGDIARSGLDVFASGALGILDPNDQAISYPIGPGGVSVPLLQLSSADSDDHNTYFFFGGARFKLPFGDKLAPRLGAEYNFGSRYMISFAGPTSNLTNKLANRGHAVEAYVIQPLAEGLWFRTSYTWIDTNYSGGFFGPAAPFGGTSPEVEQTLRSLSFALDATF
ncbi:MAG: DUF3373 family protein [Polyangiaceae bacterium]